MFDQEARERVEAEIADLLDADEGEGNPLTGLDSLSVAEYLVDLVLARVSGFGSIIVPRPHVANGPQGVPADEADVAYLRKAAAALEGFYKPFGSTVRGTVVQLVGDAANAIEAQAGRDPWAGPVLRCEAMIGDGDGRPTICTLPPGHDPSLHAPEHQPF